MTDVVLPPDVPEEEDNPEERRVDIFEQFSMFAGQRARGFDIQSLNDSQRDKLMDILGDHEKNAYQYHLKKLEVEDAKHKRVLQSRDKSHTTSRIIIIGSLLLLGGITGSFIIWLNEYLIHWLTFLGGLGSGFGISKTQIYFSQSPDEKIHAES